MNRSDEVKIKDLPIAEQFNDNDHMIIDDGSVARKFKMGTLQEQLQTNIQTTVDTEVDKQLKDYDTKVQEQFKAQNDNVAKQLTAQNTKFDAAVVDLKQDVANQLEASSLPFFVDENGRLLVRVREEQ